MFKARVLLSAVAALALTAGAVAAQPEVPQSLRIIVPYSPGGTVDMVARRLAERLANQQKSVVVENKPGAAGTVAIEAIKNGPKDGSYLLVMDPAIVINPMLQPSLSYRYGRDLKVASVLTQTPLVLSVNSEVPAKSVQELIALSKREPGKINYSSAGVGTTPHMAGELFKLATGADITHIPYKGGAAATADLLAGRVQMAFRSPDITVQYTNEGKLRGLGTTGAARSRLYPDAPTIAELGYPDVQVALWVGVFVSDKVEDAVIKALNADINAAWDDEALRKSLSDIDIRTMKLGVEESAQYVGADEKKWNDVVNKANISAQ
jgi:tripartite-type tricarboxylate transporter receptor subunit TctC